jgi:hypothetical protein
LLWAIDGVDVGGKALQEIKYQNSDKNNGAVRPTFQNKYWFDSSDRKYARKNNSR